MKLYIANGTRQTFNFQYRLPGVGGLRQQVIPAGKQLMVSGDLSSEEVAYIIEKNARYGLVDCNKIDRSKIYNGLVYSIDRPVPAPRLNDTFDHNLEVLEEQGRKNREMAALTANDTYEHRISDDGLVGQAGMDIEIIEEPTRENSDRPTLREGWRVNRYETDRARVERKPSEQNKGGRGNRRKG